MLAIFQALTRWTGGSNNPAALAASLDSDALPVGAPVPHSMPFSELLDTRQTKGVAAEARQRGLVRTVVGIMKNQALPGAGGRRQGASAVRERALLFSDRPLAAYWLSVSRGGQEAWDEELARLRRTKAGIVKGLPLEHRLGVSNTGSIELLIPLYRQWGTMLLDAGAVPDISELAANALAAWKAL